MSTVNFKALSGIAKAIAAKGGFETGVRSGGSRPVSGDVGFDPGVRPSRPIPRDIGFDPGIRPSRPIPRDIGFDPGHGGRATNTGSDLLIKWTKQKIASLEAGLQSLDGQIAQVREQLKQANAMGETEWANGLRGKLTDLEARRARVASDLEDQNKALDRLQLSAQYVAL